MRPGDLLTCWKRTFGWCGPCGTSLSKAYGAIQRFSEDVDLTYDIRAIAGDLIGDGGTPLPTSKSQEKKWSKEIRTRLADWVTTEVVPRLQLDLGQRGMPATARADGDKVFIDATPLVSGPDFSPPRKRYLKKCYPWWTNPSSSTAWRRPYIRASAISSS